MHRWTRADWTLYEVQELYRRCCCEPSDRAQAQAGRWLTEAVMLSLLLVGLLLRLPGLHIFYQPCLGSRMYSQSRIACCLQVCVDAGSSSCPTSRPHCCPCCCVQACAACCRRCLGWRSCSWGPAGASAGRRAKQQQQGWSSCGGTCARQQQLSGELASGGEAEQGHRPLQVHGQRQWPLRRQLAMRQQLQGHLRVAVAAESAQLGGG